MPQASATPSRDVIVIGASAGGVEALTKLCARLPGDLPAAVFVVQHLSPDAQSLLPRLLSRAGPLRAETPLDGEHVRHGKIYVAPPDLHMLLRPGQVLLRRGPQENRSRPAIDALFRSAAVAYGARVIGVVLTGVLDDGTQGLVAVKQGGGICVVQDPADALWPSMPRNALRRDHVDYCVPLTEMPALFVRLIRERPGESLKISDEIVREDHIAEQEFAVVNSTLDPPGDPSALACPTCGGVLNEITVDKDIRYRCQIGHAFTAQGLEAAQHDELERALGIAVRTHRDRLALFERMEGAARGRNFHHAAQRWHEAASDARQLAAVLEKAIRQLKARGGEAEEGA